MINNTKLSDRLKIMADLIKAGETVADIGTDHGFLPMYLVEKGISPKVILTDISRASLNKAVSNIASKNYSKETESSFDYRCGQGLEILEKAEVDCITIAGMGGILITEILGKDLEKTKGFQKFILQPRNAQAELRFWLREKGFDIVFENLVREGKYICEIITAVSNKKYKMNSQENWLSKFKNLGERAIQYEIPEPKLASNEALYGEFLERKLRKEKNILKALKNAVEDVSLLEEERLYRMGYIEELIEREKVRRGEYYVNLEK